MGFLDAEGTEFAEKKRRQGMERKTEIERRLEVLERRVRALAMCGEESKEGRR